MSVIILSIDGGGIRGVIPAAILDYLEKRVQEKCNNNRIKIGELVDLVAGTSTGSILGSLMLLPQGLPCDMTSENELDILKCRPKYSMEEILQLYFELGNDVFATSFFHNLRTLWGLMGPKYPDSNLTPPLLKLMDHYKLSDLIKPCMFTGYDIHARRAHFYTNLDKHKDYANFYVKDVVRGSIAVPSFFSPAFFKDGPEEHTIIDGGIYANNPSMCAYIEASKTLINGSREQLIERDPNNTVMISIGTGSAKQKPYTYKKSRRWGKAQWLLPVIDVMLTSSSEVVNYQMHRLYKAYDKEENYFRLNPELRVASTSFNDASDKNLSALLKDAKTWIDINKEELEKVVCKICECKHVTSF